MYNLNRSLVLVYCVATSAAAQSTAPTDSTLVAYDNVWRYSTIRLSDSTVRVLGLWTDHLERRSYEGRQIWARVQGMTYPNGLTSSTVNGFELGTMRAVFMESRGVYGAWTRRDFFSDSIITRRRKTGATHEDTTRIRVTPPLYDFYGGLYGVLLVGLPLQVGMRGQLPAIGEFVDSLMPAPYLVLRRESMKAGTSGVRDCWVVESHQDEYTLTFWLSKQAPFIIRLQMDSPAGVRSVFEML